MIQIVNLRKELPYYSYDFYVDRRSVLGNPFPLENESQRNKVCDEYIKYFNERLEGSDDLSFKFRSALLVLYNTYKETGALRLFCWCHPKRCHAITIKKWVEGMIEKPTM